MGLVHISRFTCTRERTSLTGHRHGSLQENAFEVTHFLLNGSTWINPNRKCLETSRLQDYFFILHDYIHTFIFVCLPFEAAQPHSWVTLFSLIHSSVPQLWLPLIGPIAIGVQKTKGESAKIHKSRYQMDTFLLHYIFLPSFLDRHAYLAHTINQMCALGPFV